MSREDSFQTNLPPPPAGYERYEPTSSYSKAGALLGIVVFIALPLAIYLLVASSQRWGLVPWLMLGAPLAWILHEALHAGAGVAFGCEITVGFRNTDRFTLDPYVVCFGTLLSRSQAIVISLAPLVVLTGAPFFLLLGATGPLSPFTAIALSVLLFNTAGSTLGPEADIQTAWRVWHLPAGTLIRDTSEGYREYFIKNS